MSALANGGVYVGGGCDCRECRQDSLMTTYTVWYCPVQDEIYVTKFIGNSNVQLVESRSGVDTSRPRYMKEDDVVILDIWKEKTR